jgi:hypothetical protein
VIAISGHRIAAVGLKQEVSLYQGEDTPLLAVQGLLVAVNAKINGEGYLCPILTASGLTSDSMLWHRKIRFI